MASRSLSSQSLGDFSYSQKQKSHFALQFPGKVTVKFGAPTRFGFILIPNLGRGLTLMLGNQFLNLRNATTTLFSVEISQNFRRGTISIFNFLFDGRFI